MRQIWKFALALCACLAAAPVQAQQPSAEQQARFKEIEALIRELHPVSGDIPIAEAEAVLHLGTDYYFLSAAEAQRVLVEGWGNPPTTVSNVLGMVFPKGKTFVDDTWGAVISFDPLGYVDDEDAQSTDYDALIEELQSGEEELNAERTRQGYPAQHLVGWAQPPAYDARSHSVVWAQNIKFGEEMINTLNYDVRLLGRRGVLSLNMVTTMDKLDQTRSAAEQLASAAAFNPGARYADYQPGADAKAEFGVAGLVAAGVGATAAKKLGLFAILLAVGKKFIVLILAGLAAAAGFARKAFARRQEEDEIYAYDAPAEEEALEAPARAEGQSEPRKTETTD